MRDTGVMIHLANVLGVGTANVVLLGDHAKIIDELSVEVERLRTQLDNALNKRLAAEHSLLDAKEQLAERDALISAAVAGYDSNESFDPEMEALRAALSASAEEQKNV